jgi:hypothetical protein
MVASTCRLGGSLAIPSFRTWMPVSYPQVRERPVVAATWGRQPADMTLGDQVAPATADITRRNASLRSEISLVRAGLGRTRSLWSTLRESVLYCPQSGEDGLLGAEAAGIHWVFVFTSLPELAAFALARGPVDSAAAHLTVRGDRLIDLLLVTLLGRPEAVHGLCIDACGAEPMLLPVTAELVGIEAGS